MKTSRGITLIELMVVVAIIGIIVAIGYPSYRDQVIKSRRAEGMGELLELADRMERHYSDVGTYTKVDGTDITIGEVFHQFTEKGNYELSIDAQSDTAFTVSAAPQGAQQADTKCGTFTLTSAGTKTASGTLPDDQCWK